VVVVDVSDPASPEEVSTFPPVFGDPPYVDVHTLFMDGNRAYMANTSLSGLQIYDLSDPRHPQKLGEYVHPEVEIRGGFVHDLFVENGRVYLNYWNLGMVILDTLEDPANPTVVGVFDSYDRRTSHSSWVGRWGGQPIAVHGDEDFYAKARFVNVDSGSDDFLDVLSTYSTRPFVSIHNVMAMGKYALLTYYQDGLRVLDVSDPSHPQKVAHYHSWTGDLQEHGYGASFYEGAIGVDFDAASGHIYLADTHRGLFILKMDE
jgi:hypothetical protein